MLALSQLIDSHNALWQGLWSSIVAAVIGLVLALVVGFKPETAPVVAPIYSVVEGVLLGTISYILNLAYPGIVMQAIPLTDEALERVEALAVADAASPLLRQGLAELPADQREAVLARVLDEDDYAVIARRAATSESVIRKRVSRGLTGLRQRLESGA